MPNIERTLTNGEQALLFRIFGDSVKYSNVKVYNKKYWIFHPDDNIMTPNGKLYAPGSTYRADYSVLSLDMQAWLIHEIVHVWQYENDMNLHIKAVTELVRELGAYDKAYPYELSSPSSDLATYRFEQQAAIVADYFLIRNKQSPEYLQPRETVPAGEAANAWYESKARFYEEGVLKSFLSNPAYLRGDSRIVLNSPAVVTCCALLSSNPAAYNSKNTWLGYLQKDDRVLIVSMGTDKPFNKTIQRWRWCEVEVKSGALNGKKGWVMITFIARISS